ncbi:hypothetical protein CR969_01405 [Candidatus Saccharibacteria bacterium]|nr:MAG: hypothetical protein CR969_01405 [Candidatus Saccharibacteria bacterium]
MTGIDSSGDIKAQPANLDVDKNTTPIIDQIKAETDQLFKKLDIETKTDLEASTPDYSDNYTDQTFSKERVISKSEYLSSVETDNTEQPSIESSVDEEIIISDQSIETSEPESLQYSRIILNQPQNEINFLRY